MDWSLALRRLLLALGIAACVLAGVQTDTIGKAFPGRTGYGPGPTPTPSPSPTPTPNPAPSIAGASSTFIPSTTSFTLAPDVQCTDPTQILLAYTAVNVGSATTVTISGGTNAWNPIVSSRFIENSGNVYASWWHQCDAADPASYTFGNDGSANSQVAGIIRIVGASTSAPVDVSLFHDFGGVTNNTFSTGALGPGTHVNELPIFTWTGGFAFGFTGPTGGFSQVTGVNQSGGGPGLQAFQHATSVDTTTTFSMSVSVVGAQQEFAAYDGVMIQPPGAVVTPTPTPTPTATPLAIAQVVVQCCSGTANDTPAPSAAVPYVYDFHNPDQNNLAGGPTGLHNAGAKHISNYVDESLVDKTNSNYSLVDVGGADAAARAVNCSGAVVNAGTGGSGETIWVTDPFNPSGKTLAFYNTDVTFRYVASQAGSAYFDAIFLDDESAWYSTITGGPMCHGASTFTSITPQAEQALSNLVGAVVVPTNLLSGGQVQPKFWLNSIGPYASNGVSFPYQSLAAANILGAMAENCWNSGPSNSNTFNSLSVWQLCENAMLIVTKHNRAFWSWEQDSTTTAAALTNRLFYWASFQITWDSNNQCTLYGATASCSVIGLPNMQGGAKGAGSPSLHAFPEWTVTCYGPRIADSNQNVSQFASGTTGVYYREYTNCYQGSLSGGVWSVTSLGKGVAVVNADTVSHAMPAFPNGTYGNHLVLSGKGVLDGGTATVTAGGPGGTIASHEGDIFTQ